MQASEAGRPCEAPSGASPGPKGHPVSCLDSDADDEDEPHCVTVAEASEARAAEAAAAAAAKHFGGLDHPEPLYMPGALDFLPAQTPFSEARRARLPVKCSPA